MYLGALSDVEVSQLICEFGLYADLSEDFVIFPESAVARSLKRIVAEHPDRAALFRKKAEWLNGWLSNVSSEESPAAPFIRGPLSAH